VTSALLIPILPCSIRLEPHGIETYKIVSKSFLSFVLCV